MLPEPRSDHLCRARLIAQVIEQVRRALHEEVFQSREPLCHLGKHALRIAANGSHQRTLDDLFAKYNVNTLEALLSEIAR